MIELLLLVALNSPEDLILERKRQRAKCYIMVTELIKDQKERRRAWDRCNRLYGNKQT